MITGLEEDGETTNKAYYKFLKNHPRPNATYGITTLSQNQRGRSTLRDGTDKPVTGEDREL